MHHLEIEAREKELSITGRPVGVEEMHADYQRERRKAARAEAAMEILRSRKRLDDAAHEKIAQDARAEAKRLNEHVADDYNQPTYRSNIRVQDEATAKDSLTVRDMVNHPSHYTQGAIECIEVLEQLAADGHDFRVLNAMKYLWRYRHKGGRESLRKARWYIERVLNDD